MVILFDDLTLLDKWIIGIVLTICITANIIHAIYAWKRR